MSIDVIKRALAVGEGPTVEFKRSLPPEDSIARVLAGFANGEGGTLLIGVEDDGSLLGLSIREAEGVVRRLRRIADSMITWPYHGGYEALRDNRYVVWITVGPAPTHLKPIRTATGTVYQRVGSSDLALLSLQSHSPSPPSKGECVVFIAMSFRTEEDPSLVDYFEAMKRAAQALAPKLRLTRIDLQEGDYEISQQLMQEIDKADAVIADFTLSSANVYFEAGYARGRSKKIIQTARKGTPLEFDIRNWRTIFYRNATELQAALVPAFTQLIRDVEAERGGA
jgi:hypothetical protein